MYFKFTRDIREVELESVFNAVARVVSRDAQLFTKLKKTGPKFLSRNAAQFLPFDYAGHILHAFGANFRHTGSGISA